MSQYFRGYLAGLSILKNKTESDSVIQCLNNCQEKLDFDAIDTNDDTVIELNWSVVVDLERWSTLA
jgi:hypothetical protein